MQHFLASYEADSTPGLRFRRPQARCRTQRQGFHLLGLTGGHALLPVGLGQQPARHHQRLGRQRRKAATSGLACRSKRFYVHHTLLPQTVALLGWIRASLSLMLEDLGAQIDNANTYGASTASEARDIYTALSLFCTKTLEYNA
jgi:hypothetical protein